jgi:hypothetical protein
LVERQTVHDDLIHGDGPPVAARQGTVTIRAGDDPAKLDPIRNVMKARAISASSD